MLGTNTSGNQAGVGGGSGGVSGGGQGGGRADDGMGGRYLGHQEQHTIDQLLALANAGNTRSDPQASTSGSGTGHQHSQHQNQYLQPQQLIPSSSDPHRYHYQLPPPPPLTHPSPTSGDYRSPSSHSQIEVDYHTSRPYGSTSHVNWDLPATSPNMRRTSGIGGGSAMTPSDSGRTSNASASASMGGSRSRGKRISHSTTTGTGAEEDQPDKIPITGEFVAESVSAALQSTCSVLRLTDVWDGS